MKHLLSLRSLRRRFQSSAFGLLLVASQAHAFEATLTPHYNAGDGTYTVDLREGQQVWIPPAYFYFKVPNFPAGSPYAYLKITYYDETAKINKRLLLQYDAVDNAYKTTPYHTRSTSVGVNAFVDSYQRLDNPLFSDRENGASDLRINCGGVPIKSIVVRDYPFEDPQALYALSTDPAWKKPYTGPTNNDVNRSTLEGKVIAGYQGWFRTPNDLYDNGFFHWTVDQWPDPADYDANSLVAYPGKTTVSGKPAYVFSSADRSVVQRHFQWMRKANIDGVYLQRFFGAATAGASPEWVLALVREAANLEGRVWAIEYDISGATDADLVSKLTTDWKFLVDTLKITQDARYLHHNGKPVVVIWGAGIRTPSAGPLNTLVDFFKNDPVYGGNYVVGCVSNLWPTAWDSHYPSYDSLFAWQGSLSLVAQKTAQFGTKAQMHVWPGFSWHNLKNLVFPTQYTPRNNGTTFWNRVNSGLTTIPSVESIFVGMFDEYDEGTAVMPMSDDPPIVTGTTGYYETNKGSSKDWWMVLSGYAQDTLCKQIPLNATMPTEAELANRSNIGSELSLILGPNTGFFLRQITTPADGKTSSATVAGVACRRLLGDYLYLGVSDTVLYKGAGGTDVTILVDYYDAAGSIDLALEYDSTANAFAVHPKAFQTVGTSSWRTARFEISDAYFGNRQTDGADFRIRSTNAARNLNISRVRVILPDEDRTLELVSQDIGAVGLAGNSTRSRGTWTINGAGAGLDGTADAFRFVQMPASGDCSITAKLTSITNTNAAAKAGVMIRQDLNVDSPYAMTAVTPGSGLTFQSRATTGAAPTYVSNAGVAPSWVRITRRGNLFTSFTSVDGVTWTEIGSQTVNMAQDVYLGLSVTSNDPAVLCRGVISSVSVVE